MEESKATLLPAWQREIYDVFMLPEFFKMDIKQSKVWIFIPPLPFLLHSCFLLTTKLSLVRASLFVIKIKFLPFSCLYIFAFWSCIIKNVGTWCKLLTTLFPPSLLQHPILPSDLLSGMVLHHQRLHDHGFGSLPRIPQNFFPRNGTCSRVICKQAEGKLQSSIAREKISFYYFFRRARSIFR